MIQAVSHGPDDTRALASRFATVVEAGDLLVLAGDLGAGKTCFTQGLARGLGVVEPVTSPTFTLANRYDSGRVVLHHLDVYRLDDLAETLDLDLPELLETGVTVIEWGEEIAAVLPADHLVIRLTYPPTDPDEAAVDAGIGDDQRVITFVPVGPGWGTRLDALRALVASESVDREAS